jgi:cellulose synthase operon protein YhjQ
MTDRGPLFDQDDTPEDVATLYSWANLHGAKYRDFSEARAQTREKARQRVQQAIEEEQSRLQKQAQAERAVDVQRVAEASRLEEQDRQAEWAAERAAQLAAQHDAEEAAMRQAALRESEQQEAAKHEAARREAAQREAALREAALRETALREAATYEAAERARQQSKFEQQAKAARQAPEHKAKEEKAQFAQQPQPMQPPSPQPASQQRAWHPLADRFANFIAPEPEPAAESPSAQPVAPPVFPSVAQPPFQPAGQQVPPQPEFPTYAPPQPSWPGTAPAQPAEMRERYAPPASSWGQGFPAPPEQRDTPTRPAWLTPERVETPSPATPGHPSEDTLQGSRDRLASRWYALRGVFDGATVQPETAPAAPPARAPVVAVFSLAGGVGKTSLVATLGRALSSRGERVLLVDTAPYGLMPFYFGAHDQRPGVLRTFSPPGTSGDAPIQMVTVDPDTLGPETATIEVMSSEISKYSRGVSRIVVDLATASGATTRRVLRMYPLVLVPMVPDMNSVVSVSSIDSFFQHNINLNSKQVMPFYILNQFDSSLPLHLDIREILREQLGDRLLPLALRRAPAVSEALAEGMTVMDYAPNSTIAEDFANLAGWVKSQSAPASSAYRGVRWSER